MPAIAKDRQKFYKSRIRALISVDHQMTHVDLLVKLVQEGISLDLDYLSKLVAKVYQERVKRVDRATLNYALAAFEDTMTGRFAAEICG
jgi:hypothetical protein